MRILIAYGSKRGGTEGIAHLLGDSLRAAGLEVDVSSADRVGPLSDYDVVIVGGALYANRWHRHARRLVRRHADELRRKPVWFFSSGPLGDNAVREGIPPTPQVAALMRRVGARGHITFGGRLERNPRGLIARAMAKTLAGDWRYPDWIHRWAAEIAHSLGVRAAGTERPSAPSDSEPSDADRRP